MNINLFCHNVYIKKVTIKQGRKRPLDTPKRMIKRRKERERKIEGEI